MRRKTWGIFIAAVAIAFVSIIVVKSRQPSVTGKIKEIESSIYSKASSPDRDERQKAIEDLESFSARFSDSGEVNKVWYAVAEIYRKQEDFLKARNAYQRIIRDYPGSEFISEVQERLWDLNMKILFSPLVTEEDTVYEVKAGDSLDAISKKFNIPVALIMKSNNLKNTYIRPKMKLKVSIAKYSVVIDKSQNALTLKSNERIMKNYNISTGENNSTPVGTFTIVDKLVNPIWYKQGAAVLPDSPENELGSRWISLSVKGYSIHGTPDAATVGGYNTEGSIRMTNPDVEELYAILPVGSEVIIVD